MQSRRYELTGVGPALWREERLVKGRYFTQSVVSTATIVVMEIVAFTTYGESSSIGPA